MSSVQPLRQTLPANIDDWVRKMKAKPTINDEVEIVHRSLVGESKEYLAYHEAIYHEEAVEGSLHIDDVKAAEMIKDKAKELGFGSIENAKLAVVVRAMKVVMSRYNMSRKERRNKAA